MNKNSLVLSFSPTLPKTIIETPTKSYVDSSWHDPSIIRNTTHVDFNDKDLDNVRFNKVNSLPAVREHLSPKFYVDAAFYHRVHEPSLLRVDPNENLKPNEQESIAHNSTLTTRKTITEIPTESYVESFHEIDKNRRDLSTVIKDQDNEFNNIKLTILGSVSVNRNPSSDSEVSNKKYVDKSINRSEGKKS